MTPKPQKNKNKKGTDAVVQIREYNITNQNGQGTKRDSSSQQ